MERLGPPVDDYPSPSSAQMMQTSGPFYHHTSNNQLPHDLHRLQAATEGHRVHQEPQVHGHNHQSAEDYQVQAQANAADDALRAQHDHTTLAQHVMTLNDTDHADDDNSTLRSSKRTKVSRACDECRRKKIRCDAADANEPNVCSNCRRTGAACQFSRTPLKRGPSKGYIKELADKINTLESRLGPYGGAGGVLPEHGYAGTYNNEFQINDDGEQRNAFAQQPPDMGRKRTHSTSERGVQAYGEPYGGGRPQPDSWALEGHRLPQTASDGMGNPQTSVRESAAGSRQLLSPRISTWRQGALDDDVADDDEADAAAAAQLDWDEEVVDEYYFTVHQTFPFLPRSKNRLKLRLARCPATLRDAFLVALDCCMRSSPQSRLNRTSVDLRQATRTAAELIARSQYENQGPQNMSISLVYIQTLILMALEADSHGPATVRGQVGPPRAEWLGRAIGMATHLKLNTSRPKQYENDDRDTDTYLGRRIWWTLFVLDRWHACSIGSLLQLPEKGFALEKDDQWLLGDSIYHLARLSYIIGHVSLIMNESPTIMASTSAAAPIITAAILGEIDRFRESVEMMLLGPPSVVHLCYWHARLLIQRLTPAATLHEFLVPAEKLATMLNHTGTTVTPLHHHFAALSALTLTELVDFEETRTSAEAGIDNLMQALTARRGFVSSETSTGWDRAIRELLTTGRQTRRDAAAASAESVESAEGDQQQQQHQQGNGLQHLADAAVGAPGKQQELHDAAGMPARRDGGSSAVGAGFDPTGVTRYGYLAALAQMVAGGSGMIR